MDVAIKFLLFPQDPRRPNQQLRRIVRRAIDTGAEEQPFNIVAPVKGNGHIGDFFRRQNSPFRVAARSIDTVGTVVDAVISHEDL